MKMLIEGVWHSGIADTPALRQARTREQARWFRGQVTADGSSGFKAEPQRYHLYVSYACPWAHRTILYRSLKGLEDVIGLSVLHPRWSGPEGWTFGETPFSTIDHPGGRRALHEIYQAAKPDFTGKVTVPVLWDSARQTIVNNESGEIIRMLNRAFDAWAEPEVDFYPAARQAEIDALNSWLLPDVCMGVYAAGFADSQAAYEQATRRVFAGLDRLETMLDDGRSYLLGEQPMEPDWHLFATTIRFETVYYGALRCNLKRLSDYPNLIRHRRRLMTSRLVRDTVRQDHIKQHYFDDLDEIDRSIVPLGPPLDGIEDLAA